MGRKLKGIILIDSINSLVLMLSTANDTCVSFTGAEKVLSHSSIWGFAI
jgi:hypothetical protein